MVESRRESAYKRAMDWSQIIALVGFFAACFAAATTGAVFKPGEWYEGLRKPSWNPPNWLFPIAWSALYIMIAVSGWLVWRQDGFGLPVWVWALQLVLNAGWSIVFFGIRRLGLAVAEAWLMWASILSCIILFAPISPAAAWLMVPYLLWVSFAIALNRAVWRLNPGPHPMITLAEMKQPSPSAAARAAARAQRAQ
jgi:tryptophan-rich sensory protein